MTIMKARLNSRQRRRNRCGFKGEGSHKWVKTSPFGKIEHIETVAERYHRYLVTFDGSKHAGSKPHRVLRQQDR